MKLTAWMKKNKLDDADVAVMTGVDRVTINRLRRGIHLPSWDTMSRIAYATEKQVMPNDFLEAAMDES
jgi:transcriptional regulator with XRE-family HTH domain